MAIGVEPVERWVEERAETVGDAEDDDLTGFLQETGGETGVEADSRPHGTNRAIEVDKVPATQRSLEDVVRPPDYPVIGDPEPALELSADLDHGAGDLDLAGPAVRVELLHEEPLKTVPRAEIDASGVRVDPGLRSEDRAQTSCMTPITSGVVDPLSFPICVRRLVHVEVGVELEESLFESITVMVAAGRDKCVHEVAIARKEAVGLWGFGKGGEELHQLNQSALIFRRTVIINQE